MGITYFFLYQARRYTNEEKQPVRALMTIDDISANNVTAHYRISRDCSSSMMQ